MKRRSRNLRGSRNQSSVLADADADQEGSRLTTCWQSFVKCIRVPFSYFRNQLRRVHVRPLSTTSEGLTVPKRHKHKEKAKSGAYTVNPDPEITEDLVAPLVEPETDDEPIKVWDCYILFLGLAGSGKTTTISKLLNCPPTPTTTEINFIEISQSSPTLNLNLIDVPGLCRGQTPQEDAEIILALRKYTTNLYPNRIPNIVFLVTRFDDNRFEGEASEFANMLRALTHAKEDWTDTRHSNVVLLLTNAGKVNKEEEDIDFKISKFQNMFYEYFPERGFPVPVALVENFGDPKSQARILDAVSLLRHDNVISSFIQSVKYDNLEETQDPIYTPVQMLLPSKPGEIYKLLDKMQLKRKDSSEDSTGLENVHGFMPWFVPAFPEKISFSTSRPMAQEVITALKPHEKIVLFDRTEIPVENLVIGHRLLDKDLKASVIISIRKLNSEDESFFHQSLGKIYCRQQHSQADEAVSSAEKESLVIYKYVNRKIRPGTLDVTPVEHGKNEVFYTLELDRHDATFICDDHVLFAKHSHPLRKVSHTSL